MMDSSAIVLVTFTGVQLLKCSDAVCWFNYTGHWMLIFIDYC
ncbi:hypothetical protein Pint_11987 [Pistacia integerrima]|uniref:Uncharacterized protein n=1 Tax=Pistacia integerrima TaxID=434235 RepID=A0ACC0XGA4_9ROSI|nr:hypothetical protein Pint_11987 [Pistacia integerrima]